jgi:hypothetical protein
VLCSAPVPPKVRGFRGIRSVIHAARRWQRRIAEAHVDRGCIASPLVDEVLADGGEVICKPWVARSGGRERLRERVTVE